MEPAWSNLSQPQPLPHAFGVANRLLTDCTLLTWVWAISTRTPGCFLDETPPACPFWVALGLRAGEGTLGHAGHFLEGGSLSKTQESWKHKESLTGANCIVQRTHSIFIALIFYSLLPQWRRMLGFRIRNWGRTDGRGAVGSNTIIKIIYTARNSPACARR